MLKFLGKIFIITGVVTFGFLVGLLITLGSSPNLTVGSALFAGVVVVTFAIAVGLFITGVTFYSIARWKAIKDKSKRDSPQPPLTNQK